MSYQLVVATKRIKVLGTWTMSVAEDWPASWTDISGQLDAVVPNLPATLFEGVIPDAMFAGVNADPKLVVLLYAQYDGSGNLLTTNANQTLTAPQINAVKTWAAGKGLDTTKYNVDSVLVAGVTTRLQAVQALIALLKVLR